MKLNRIIFAAAFRLRAESAERTDKYIKDALKRDTRALIANKTRDDIRHNTRDEIMKHWNQIWNSLYDDVRSDIK